MSVVPNEIVIYGSANMPEADGVTVGGAIDLTKRVAFYDLPTTGTFDVVSSSASDTAVRCQITGRDATGTIVTPAFQVVNGTTVVTPAFSSQSFQRLLSGVITGGAIGSLSDPAGTAAVGDIAVMATTKLLTGRTAQTGSANKSGTTPPLFKLQSGDGATVGATVFAGLNLIIRITGGTGANQLRMISVPYAAGAYGTDVVAVNRDWTVVPDNTSTYNITYGFLFDILPNPVKAITRIFATAQADIPGGSTRTFYEKVFALNTNAATALTTASIQVASESPVLPGTALLDLALTTALNDNQTAANRQTLPTNQGGGALTFVTQPAFISVPPAPGSLPNGNTAAQAEAMWLRLTLPAGTTVYQGAADVRTTGSTT